MSENSEGGSSGGISRRTALKALAVTTGVLTLAGVVKLATGGKPETLTEEQQLIKALESDNNTILHPKINETDPQKINEFWETVASNRQNNLVTLVQKYPDSARNFFREKANISARDALKLKLKKADRWVEEEIAEKWWTGIIYEETEPNNYGFQRQIGGKNAKYYGLLVAGQPDPIIPGPNEIVGGFAIASKLLPNIGAVRPIKN